MSADWRAVRDEFPALHGRTYLNTATYGQLPRRATEAAARHFTRRDENGCTDFLSWFDDLAPLREALARLIHAAPDDIAFIGAASQGLALVMQGIEWREGDEILTLEREFPNQIYAAQARHGVRGVVARWEEIEEHLSSRTRLVLLSTVNYQTGLRPDLDAVLPKLRERGVVTYVDGTQSIGALGFDCAGCEPDFLAVDAYKWLMSPNGAGFLYVAPRARKWLRPSVIGWRSDREWRSVENLHQGAPRFSGTAEQYEGGMLPFPSLYAMKASVELVQELGAAAIEARVLELARQVRGELLALGGELYPRERGTLDSQILLAKLPGLDSSLAARRLRQEEIHVSARGEYLRISPHYYNLEDDIARFVDALRVLRTQVLRA